MGSTIILLLPLMIAAAVPPGRFIMLLILLRSKESLAVATAFVAGLLSVRLLQGAIFGLLFDNTDSSDGANDPKTIVSIVLLILGLLMLVTAVRLVMKEDDPDAPPPNWMTSLGALSMTRAFGTGALLMVIAAKHWVFTLGAISTIAEEGIGQPGSTLAFLIFVLGAELLVLAPLVTFVVAPTWSSVAFASAGAWLEAHNDQIKIVVSGVFGAYFIWKSLTNLL